MSSLFKKPKAPQYAVPSQPVAPPVPEPVADEERSKAKEKEKRLRAGMGRKSTLVTGGLGDTSTPNIARKKLLGD